LLELKPTTVLYLFTTFYLGATIAISLGKDELSLVQARSFVFIGLFGDDEKNWLYSIMKK
jgi:hypothetical protein